MGTAVLVAMAGVFPGAAPAMAAPANVREAQWYLTPLKIPQAQQVTRGAGVVVAVVDTAIDGNHPDLAGQVLQGTGIGAAPGNGWGTDRSTVHGTGMASLIAGRGGDPMRLLGIAPDARILPVATPQDARGPDPRSVAEGIRWAADHGAKVINVSSGHTGAPLSEEIDAVRYAMAKDAVVVAGVGNTSAGMIHVISPASIPGVVAVSGVVQSGDFWSGSATGPQTVVAAPAKDIPVAVPSVESSSGYDIGNGTSDSTAIVSGVVALIRARYPKLDAANVINRLIRTARDNGDPGRDPLFGFGTIRPLDALTADVPAVSRNPLLGDASAGPSASAAATQGKPAAASSGTGRWILFALAGGVLVLIVLGVVLAITFSRRTPRSPPGPGYPGRPAVPYPPGPGGPYPPGRTGPPPGGVWSPNALPPPRPGGPPPGVSSPPGAAPDRPGGSPNRS